MQVEFLAQPTVRIGDLIESGSAQFGPPQQLVMVSAFASLATVLRMKPLVGAVRAAGGVARLVLGVDLGGTSKEVLQEVASWAIPVTIVKNKLIGVTFHPKVYLLRWAVRAEVIVGSSNLTEGGFYRNYEACSRTVFTLPDDANALDSATSELARFLTPSGPTAALLTPAYLASLLALPEIPSEAEARRARGEGMAKKPSPNQPTHVFGYEAVPPPPTLPTELQRLLLAARSSQQEAFKKAIAKARAETQGLEPGAPVPLPPKPAALAQLDPSAFYMTLATTKGANNPNIPGEQRIPLEAIEMAEDFWGWDDNYDRVVSPRAGAHAKEPRVYRNWRPVWRIWSTDAPADVTTTPVRMYLYENSSDFRFYSGDLVRLGATAGDIVRLRRIDEGDIVYECVLARQGTADHAAWLPLLVNEVRNSDRRFGFA